MKSTIHGVRSFDRSPTTLLKTFLVGWCDFIQQNCFNLTQTHSKAVRRRPMLPLAAWAERAEHR